MKLVSIISLSFMSVVFVSCTSKTNSDNQLLGTWILTSEEVVACTDAPENYHETIPCSDSTCFKITFARQGKMKVQINMGGTINSWNQSYTVNGNKISICDSTGCKDQGTFTIRDSELTLANSSEQGCIKKEYYKKSSTEL